jgi:hypothetical protein
VAIPAELPTEMLGLANDASVAADNWVMIAPYGDHPNRLGDTTVIQRFDREAADSMVGFFNSFAGKLSRLWQGIPLFVGHPDTEDPQAAARYTDKRVHGRFQKIEARVDGLWGLLDPEPTAKAMVNSRSVIKLSPRWFAAEAPVAVENGVAVYRPLALASVGLTNRPNISSAPALPMLNEEPNQTQPKKQEDSTMNELLKFVAGLLGFANEAPQTATDEPKPELIAKVKTGLQTLATDLANEKKAKADAEAAVTKLTAEKDSLAQEFNNERAARISDAIATAIADGRITAADKPAWERRLKADFANELPELKKLAAKVKTASQTTDASQRTAQMGADGVTRVTELINEELAKLPRDTRNAWDVATKIAMRKHPEAFTSVKSET